jgi:hypothetical protein
MLGKLRSVDCLVDFFVVSTSHYAASKCCIKPVRWIDAVAKCDGARGVVAQMTVNGRHAALHLGGSGGQGVPLPRPPPLSEAGHPTVVSATNGTAARFTASDVHGHKVQLLLLMYMNTRCDHCFWCMYSKRVTPGYVW